MAKKFDEIGVSEDEGDQEIELETETSSVQAPVVPGGEPPRKTERGTVPPGGGERGGRQPRGAVTTPGFVARTTQFLHDVRAEMRRVSWPSAKEVKNTTIITLIAVVFFAIYLFLIDRVWAFLIEHLRTSLGG